MRYKRILIITAIAVFWFSIANLPTISAMGSDDSSLTCDFIAGNWDFTETMRHCYGFIGGGDYSMVIRNDCSYTTPGGTLSGVWTISGHTISTTFDDPFGQCGLYTWIATVSCNEMYGTISSTGGSSGTLYFQRTSEPPEVAGFTADLNSGLAPLTVNFTDQSTGDITSWSWDFGDGASSTEQNPSHTYTDAGTYTVSLAVTGPCGPDTKTKKNYISVFEDYDFTIEPSQGTIGTEVEVNITNSSSLWEKAPKVLIGETKCKVTTFTPTSVSCLLKKIKNTNPPGTYDVTIIRKGKGVQPIVLPSAFSIMAPEIQNIEPDIGEAEEEVTIFGSFFGTKKVKAYMDDGINKKKCKVTSLTMVSTTGESELKILVPKKGLLPGQCDVTVTNKVGEDTLVGGFTIQ